MRTLTSALIVVAQMPVVSAAAETRAPGDVVGIEITHSSDRVVITIGVESPARSTVSTKYELVAGSATPQFDEAGDFFDSSCVRFTAVVAGTADQLRGDSATVDDSCEGPGPEPAEVSVIEGDPTSQVVITASRDHSPNFGDCSSLELPKAFGYPSETATVPSSFVETDDYDFKRAALRSEVQLSVGGIARATVATNRRGASGDSWDPAISRTGRFVAFSTEAVNLKKRGCDSHLESIYMRDVQRGETINVSERNGVAVGDDWCPSVTDDGTRVGFRVEDEGDSRTYVLDRRTARVAQISMTATGQPTQGGCPRLSGNGRFAVFRGWRGTHHDDGIAIMLWDARSGLARKVPRSGNLINARISRRGRFMAFESTKGEHFVVIDRDRGSRHRIHVDYRILSLEAVWLTRMSANGRRFAMGGWGETAYQVVVYDRWRDQAQVVSTTESGQHGNGHSLGGALSGTGRFVAFTSSATDLVAEEVPEGDHVYVRDLRTGVLAVIKDSDGDPIAGKCAGISGDGSKIALVSSDPGLTAGDTNHSADIFLIPNPLLD